MSCAAERHTNQNPTPGLGVRWLRSNENRPPATKVVVRTIPSVNAKINHVFNMSGSSEMLFILHLSLYIYLSPPPKDREREIEIAGVYAGVRACVRACVRAERNRDK